MTASVVRLSSVAGPRSSMRVDERHAAPGLPLYPDDFAGRVQFWPESRLGENTFDRVLQLGGIKTIIDLRDTPILGSQRSQHHQRCRALDRWRIDYLRLGAILARAERQALLPFEVSRIVARLLEGDSQLASRLQEALSRGGTVVIYPEQGKRVDAFLSACHAVGLEAFLAWPFKR